MTSKEDREIVAYLMVVIATFVGVLGGFILGLPTPTRVTLGACLGILAYFHVIHRTR